MSKALRREQAVRGPLGSHASGYRAELIARGYSLDAVRLRLWQLDHLSRWLERAGLAAGELTPARVDEFLEERRARGYRSWVLRSPYDSRETRVDVNRAEPGPDEDPRPDAEPPSDLEPVAPDAAAEPTGNAQATQGRFLARKVRPEHSAESQAPQGRRGINSRVALAALLVAVGIATVLVVMALAAGNSSQKAQDSARSISGAANALLTNLLNAETGQRGYLLTGHPNYLQPYHEGIAAVPVDLRALGALTASPPALAARTARLRTLSAEKLSISAATISLNESGHRRAALALVDTGEGKHTMDLARAQVSALLAAAAALPRGPRNRARRATDIAIVVDGALFLFVVALGLIWRAQGKRSERARQAGARELVRLAQAAEYSTDAVISFDRDLRIRHWNVGAERLYGYSAAEVLGRRTSEVATLVSESTQGIAESQNAVQRALGGERVLNLESRRRHKNGTEFHALITVTPWRVDGRIVGATTTATDISEQKAAEREREQALAELEEAQRLARLGSWTWDSNANSATWSAHTYELFERDPAAGPAVGDLLLLYVHPDDLERIKDYGVKPGFSEPEFEFDFRILAGQERQERVLHAIGHADPDRPGRYRGTFQDVSEQRRADAAEAANQAKSEFLSRMSHELRTPLNAISGFGQLLAMDDLAPQQAEHVGYVLKGANHMLALVDDVLDFSRIEAGQLKVSPEPTALAATVSEAVALVATLAADNNVTLQVDNSGLAGGEHVHADARRLKQVLLNVLSNAIKYNQPGGRVDVSFEVLGRAAARMRILVSDTGIGIAPDHLEKLFEPFERLGVEKRAIDGTGLGLTLSKALIEAMGGTITASSTVGVGSTFALELAMVPGPVAAHEQSTSEQQTQSSQPSGEVPARRRVLYIEDNVSNLRLAERILERLAAVELIEAMQGSLGLTLARDRRPDLIILDLQLPDMQGEEVLGRLKADPRTRDIPVVVLTADASKGTAERLMRLGASEFVSKPLDVRRFLAVVQPYIDDAERPDSSA
jgi:PAS domain S-box-containing protein